ncbi:hypothetical protein DXV76_02920 [Rhodobacteraceae bacterium CCMM004]|nr:hypothetical protein DXV76_02920 [Rhodobacteraceae bacterium CCMM004]
MTVLLNSGDTAAPRLERVALADGHAWVKRPERLRWLRRLQKGDARAGFEAERRALKALAAAGAPVPRIVDEGADWFATEECGITLDRLVGRAEGPRAFAAAGRALADLHRAGFSHGRPAPKDMAWDGTRIALLDLERYAEARNTPRGHAWDLAIFVFSLHALAGDGPETGAAVAAYRAADRMGTWDRAARLVRRLAWVAPLARWVAATRPEGRGKEWRAVAPTLAAFAQPSRD